MLTRKHYQMVAKAIKKTEARVAKDFGRSALAYHGADITLGRVVENLADEFAKDNPNFDRARFMKACGFPEEE